MLSNLLAPLWELFPLVSTGCENLTNTNFREEDHPIDDRIEGGDMYVSTWEESAPLRKAITILPLSTGTPSYTNNTDHESAHDDSVGFPVLGLTVPTTSWWPDVFWIRYFTAAALFDPSLQSVFPQCFSFVSHWWTSEYHDFGLFVDECTREYIQLMRKVVMAVDVDDDVCWCCYLMLRSKMIDHWETWIKPYSANAFRDLAEIDTHAQFSNSTHFTLLCMLLLCNIQRLNRTTQTSNARRRPITTQDTGSGIHTSDWFLSMR